MTLEEIFKGAENQTLSWEQFQQASTGAKFVDLTEGNYVSKSKYDDELATRESRISSLNDTIKSRDTDLAGLKTQLEQAGADGTKLVEITNQLNDLQKQYDKDTKAYQKQLRDQAYEFAVKEFADGINFTSAAAKRDFTRTLKEKNYRLSEFGTIPEANDFKAAYEAENPDAFTVVTPEPTPAPSKPTFAAPTNPEPTPSKKTLSELMAMKNENPDAIITY